MNSVQTTQLPVVMVRKKSGALMSPRGPGAVALTLRFTSWRSHPVPSLRWGCENTIKYFFLASFSAPWCHLSDGCNLTHDYGYVYCSKQYRKKQKKENTLVSIYLYGVAFPSKRIFFRKIGIFFRVLALKPSRLSGKAFALTASVKG